MTGYILRINEVINKNSEFIRDNISFIFYCFFSLKYASEIIETCGSQVSYLS
jgi:hypothetical protein